MENNNIFGVISLLADARKYSGYQGNRYFFKGDLCQLSTAEMVANQLGITTLRDGGLPFVTSQKDFDTVTKHLISHKIEGWHHYVTREEYRKISGKYTFGGKYLPYETTIIEIANKLNIYVNKTASSVLYATSEKDYDTISRELDKILT